MSTKIFQSAKYQVSILSLALFSANALAAQIDQIEFKPRFRDVMQFSLPMCLIIGICQCFAMIPGVSRSGATIVSAMLLGADYLAGLRMVIDFSSRRL